MPSAAQRSRTRPWHPPNDKVQRLLDLYGDITKKRKRVSQKLDGRPQPRPSDSDVYLTTEDAAFDPFHNAWTRRKTDDGKESAKIKAPLRPLSPRRLSRLRESTSMTVFHADPSVVVSGSTTSHSRERLTRSVSSPILPSTRTSRKLSPTANIPRRRPNVVPSNVSSSLPVTRQPGREPPSEEKDLSLEQLDRLVHSLLGFDAVLPVVDGMEDAVQEAITAMADGDSRAAAEAILNGFDGFGAQSPESQW